MKTLAIFVGCLWSAALWAQPADHALMLDPSEWSVQTYYFPGDPLQPAPEPGELRHPSLLPPPDSASEEQILDFIRKSTGQVKAIFTSAGLLLPKGTLAAHDPTTQTLAVRTQNLVQDQIAAYTMVLGERGPKNLVFHLHVVELDAALLRGLMKQTASTGQRTLWRQIQPLLLQGKAREISVLRTETVSGMRMKATQGEQRQHDAGFTLEKFDHLTVQHESRTVGTTFTLEPTLCADGRQIDLVYDLTRDVAAPTERWATAAQKGPVHIESRLTDFHAAHLATAATTFSGMTKLIGIWKPESGDNLQAAFLTCDAVGVLPPLDNRMAQLLKQYGDKVEPLPAKKTTRKTTAGMVVRCFHVPPDFLVGMSRPGNVEDPFDKTAKSPSAPPHVTAQQVFEGAGVPFPEGAAAFFDSHRGELIVRNLPANLDSIEAYAESRTGRQATTITLSLQVVQAEAGLMQQCMARNRDVSDHSTALQALEEAAAQGRARMLDSAWLETRSGQKATFHSGVQFMTLSPFVAPAAAPSSFEGGVEAGPKHEPPPEPNAGPAVLRFVQGATDVGLSFEVEPTLSPDGQFMEITYAFRYDYAPPVPHPAPERGGDGKEWRVSSSTVDFREATINSAARLRFGATHLLGIWKPEGAPELQNADVLQAAFLKAEVVMLHPDE